MAERTTKKGYRPKPTLRRGAWTNCRRDNLPYQCLSSQLVIAIFPKTDWGGKCWPGESRAPRPARLGPLKAPARGDVPGATRVGKPAGCRERAASCSRGIVALL